MPNLTAEQLRAAVLAGFIRGNVDRVVSSRDRRTTVDSWLVDAIMEAVQPLAERIVALEARRESYDKRDSRSQTLEPAGLPDGNLRSEISAAARRFHERERLPSFSQDERDYALNELLRLCQSANSSLSSSSSIEFEFADIRYRIKDGYLWRRLDDMWETVAYLPELGQQPIVQSAPPPLPPSLPLPEILRQAREALEEVVRAPRCVCARGHDTEDAACDCGGVMVRKALAAIDAYKPESQSEAVQVHMGLEALGQVCRHGGGATLEDLLPWDELSDATRSMYCGMAEAVARAVQGQHVPLGSPPVIRGQSLPEPTDAELHAMCGDDECSIFGPGDWLRIFAAASLAGLRAKYGEEYEDGSYRVNGVLPLADARAVLAAIEAGEAK